MQAALHLKTTILPGGRIELEDSELPAGQSVEVIVLLPNPPTKARQSALDILAQAPGQRIFKTADDVDAYIKQERDAWDS